MTTGIFQLVKDEILWVGPWLACWLPHVEQIVIFDGNSTDGTLDVIKDFQRNHPDGKKIDLFENKDPKDLRDDYVKHWNEAISKLRTDWAAFIHPDMVSPNPEKISNIGDGVAAFSRMRSFAGEPGGQLYEIEGRGARWKNLYRNDFGLTYHGWYGAANEDCYHTEIVGASRVHHGQNFDRYPYEVRDSGLELLHFSDVRPFVRRLDRMKKCLHNQGLPESQIDSIALAHPRVTLKDGAGLVFREAFYPKIFSTWKESLCVAG